MLDPPAVVAVAAFGEPTGVGGALAGEARGDGQHGENDGQAA